jgi:hypothetical protein
VLSLPPSPSIVTPLHFQPFVASSPRLVTSASLRTTGFFLYSLDQVVLPLFFACPWLLILFFIHHVLVRFLLSLLFNICACVCGFTECSSANIQVLEIFFIWKLFFCYDRGTQPIHDQVDLVLFWY